MVAYMFLWVLFMDEPSPEARKARAPMALLRESVRELSRPLPAALAGKEDAVHALRVAARRLKMAIRLLALKPEGRRARRCLEELRTVTRMAGISRDLDVSLEIWVREGSAAAVREERRLRASLRGLRGRARAHLVEELLDSDIGRLRRRLRELLARGGAPRAEALRRASELAASSGEGIRTGFAGVGSSFDPVALHALRRQCRRMRYAAEIVAALLRGHEPLAVPFRRLQDLLGALHDRHVLGTLLTLRAASARAAGHAAIGNAAEAGARWAEAEARERHRAALSVSPETIAAEGIASLLLVTKPAARPAGLRRRGRPSRPRPLTGGKKR